MCECTRKIVCMCSGWCHVLTPAFHLQAKLAELVNNAQDGDILFIQFSGHGTQVQDKSGTGEEADGKDEAICPTDFNLITDDDLRAIFKPLEGKKDVKLTMIAGEEGGNANALLEGVELSVSRPPVVVSYTVAVCCQQHWWCQCQQGCIAYSSCALVLLRTSASSRLQMAQPSMPKAGEQPC